MISVVIPAYNAAPYIYDTLESIRSQGVHSEIILVDDGSSDDTGVIVTEKYGDTIKVLCQPNSGVSVARNIGLQAASGDYVVFFDADDHMPSGFLQDRLTQLQLHPEWIYVCGPVKSFPIELPPVRGIGANAEKIILCYYQGYSTCPSNYLFRRSHLIKHGILFNDKLSSTADRFFLLQIASTGAGGYVDITPLAYRVSSQSMSHKLSERLIFDNLNYFKMVEVVFMQSPHIHCFKMKAGIVIGLSFMKLKNFRLAFKYLGIAFFVNPFSFLVHFWNRLSEKRSNAVTAPN